MGQRLLGQLKQISLLNACIVAALLVFYGSYLTHPINLVTADLGRHLKNGELFFRDLNFIRTNFYSYTQPDFPVVTHHWASGALFYLVFTIGGWIGLELFFVALLLLAFFIAFMMAKQEAGWGIAAAVAIPVVPLLAERTEIRPEIFSVLFAVVFFYILVAVRNNRLRARWLLLLPAIELLWVNAHIFFVLGPALVGAFLLEALCIKALRMRTAKMLALAFVLCAGFTVINPFGIEGAAEPFTILREYGYRLVENQPVWFIEKLIPNPNYAIFKFVFGVLLCSVVLFFARYPGNRQNAKRNPEEDAQGGDPRLVFLFLAVGFSLMGWLQIRNFALFGLFALPIIAGNVGAALRRQIQEGADDLRAGAAMLVGLVFLVTIAGGLRSFFPTWNGFRFGLEPGNAAPAEFFRKHALRGPVFNNYDIGGYLIYHLFPQERPFVDNRPEAYSVAFFQEEYIPMQESDERWESALVRYGFNTIFFYWRDATPWAQRFLIARLGDPEWVPVFADDRALILVRNREPNRSVIEKHAIPKERFGHYR